ncbi:hypothetical protein [Roseomonas sp. WA12]
MGQRETTLQGRLRAGVAVLPLLLGLPALAEAAGQPDAEMLVIPVQGGQMKNPAPGGSTPPARPAPPTPPAPTIARTPEAAATTPPLQPDRPVSVSLRQGEQAYFRVAPEAGEAWSVETRRLARNTDTVLAALDEDGEAVTEDDDGGQENLASRIEIQPGDGARLVRAGTLSDAGGRFQVVLTRQQPLPPPDFATTPAEAAGRPPLALGQPVQIRLRRSQQAFFNLPEDRADMIAVTRDLSRGTDTVLALIDSTGRVLMENDDGGDGLASELSIAQAAPGPLLLRAGLVSDSAGTFTVVVEREAPMPPPNYPTSLEQARVRDPLTPGQTIRVELGRGSQAFFALPEGQPLMVTTRNLGRNVDTVLALLDAQGEQVLEDDDGGEGLASRVITTNAPSPAAFVRASLLNGARGGFDMVVQAAVPPAAPSAGAVAAAADSLEAAKTRPTLSLGEAVRVRVTAGGEAFIALPHDGRAAMAMTFDLGSEVDTVLALLDESGAVIEENDDAEGLASRLAIPPSPRPAFLRVKLLEDRAGEFSLVLVRPAS